MSRLLAIAPVAPRGVFGSTLAASMQRDFGNQLVQRLLQRQQGTPGAQALPPRAVDASVVVQRLEIDTLTRAQWKAESYVPQVRRSKALQAIDAAVAVWERVRGTADPRR